MIASVNIFFDTFRLQNDIWRSILNICPFCINQVDVEYSLPSENRAKSFSTRLVTMTFILKTYVCFEKKSVQIDKISAVGKRIIWCTRNEIVEWEAVRQSSPCRAYSNAGIEYCLVIRKLKIMYVHKIFITRSSEKCTQSVLNIGKCSEMNSMGKWASLGLKVRSNPI